jgi:site-specific DNA recombinase
MDQTRGRSAKSIRAAIYARYSSDLQREASIEDQLRLCRELIERERWVLIATHTDSAMSGASRLRPGYQKVLEGARMGQFDVVVAEALDRLSRDQEDIAGFYKQLMFHDVKLVTLAEGEISELHVGLKGTMNALFLKDLAAKTRRGLRGRVEKGRSGGGLCYGYDVARELDASGRPVAGGPISTRRRPPLSAESSAPSPPASRPRRLPTPSTAPTLQDPEGRLGGLRPYTATGGAAPASSTTNSTSAGWCGIGSTSSRTRQLANGSRAPIPPANG